MILRRRKSGKFSISLFNDASVENHGLVYHAGFNVVPSLHCCLLLLAVEAEDESSQDTALDAHLVDFGLLSGGYL